MDSSARTVPTTSQAVTFSAILLDLDGMIIDSGSIIKQSFQATFAELGLPIPSLEELNKFIGPPLQDSFADFVGLTGEANFEAVECYRQHYVKVMFNAPVYDGIPELLRAIRDTGIPLSLATSKREPLARETLEYLQLDQFFTVIAGAAADGSRAGKAEVIATALERLQAADADLTRVVHVGDRQHDVAGAQAHGLESIGVLWGYGDAEELAAATWLAQDPAQLAQLLGIEV